MSNSTSFLHRPSEAKIIFIYDSTERNKHMMENMATHLERRTKKPIEIISARSQEGADLIRKFHLRGTHFVLVIRPDGELHHSWTNEDLLDAPHIANIAEQI